ncbi:MAG: hypothetical protein AB1646_03920 [Thermodesulfobacteriota bacterium]
METVRWLLECAFVYGVYPAVIVTIVAGMGLGIERAVRLSENRMRPLVGAVLPFAILGFLVVTQQSGLILLAESLKGLSREYQLLLGAVVALSVGEAARLLLRTKTDRAYAIHTMILSANAAFIIWVVMSGALDAINMGFLGYVLAGGLWVISRGFPVPQPRNQESESDSKA